MFVTPTLFNIAALPRIIFGAGTITQLPKEIIIFGKRVLLVTGKGSFRKTKYWQPLTNTLEELHISYYTASIQGEPSPKEIDSIVKEYHQQNIDIVVGIGGGSAMDAAKAIAGMLPHENSVMDHLEGVGHNIPYPGSPLPFIAVPTTAGTGSEITKNAVLSSRSEHGFKKSFRHDSLIANTAIIDPLLLESCPQNIIAANGMDAFVQLLESYVSPNANTFTDALAWSGIETFHENFMHIWKEKGNTQHYAGIAYASFISGITLAHVGLGSIHALASPIGAFSDMPHGEVCGTLLAVATDLNIQTLQEKDENNIALKKYARVGRLVSNSSKHLSDTAAQQKLIETLESWVEALNLPKLSKYNIDQAMLEKITNNMGSMQNNPVALTQVQLINLLKERL